jgi:aspartokinase-like uncharacterized kinase
MNMDSPIRIIKIGGSLLGRVGLPQAIECWAANVDSHVRALNVWVVGGGAAVDVIRDLDAEHGLPAEVVHWSSIRMMDVNARLLAHHFPAWNVVDRLGKIISSGSRLASEDDSVEPVVHSTNLLVQPTAIIQELERSGLGSSCILPASWDVTSDSIAAWLGMKLGAMEVVLLKSCSVPDVDLRQLQALGVVDRYIGKLPLDFDKLTLRCERLI